jgi:hypothetical protein
LFMPQGIVVYLSDWRSRRAAQRVEGARVVMGEAS